MYTYRKIAERHTNAVLITKIFPLFFKMAESFEILYWALIRRAVKRAGPNKKCDAVERDLLQRGDSTYLLDLRFLRK